LSLDAHEDACSSRCSCSIQVVLVPRSGCQRVVRSLLLRTSQTTPYYLAPHPSSSSGCHSKNLVLVFFFFFLTNLKNTLCYIDALHTIRAEVAEADLLLSGSEGNWLHAQVAAPLYVLRPVHLCKSKCGFRCVSILFFIIQSLCPKEMSCRTCPSIFHTALALEIFKTKSDPFILLFYTISDISCTR
jgi:hypothetical protein